MWLYFMHAIIRLAGSFAFVLTFFMLICFLYGAYSFFRLKRTNLLDTIILVFMTYIFLNTIAIDYPHHINFLVFAFFFQVCPFMCYFIARTNDLEFETVLKKMVVPITIIMVLGVYFHLAQPEWYTALKWTVIYNRYGSQHITDNHVIEHMRLSSIFDSSYYVAYATFFFSTYLLYALTFKALQSNKQVLYVALLILCVVVLIFANHRSTILGFIIAYLFCFVKGKNKAIRRYFVLGACVIAVIFIVIVFSSEEYLNYITMRFEGVTTKEGFQDRFDHTGGEQNLFTLFGEGFGRYSIRAREYDGWALIDSQYQNILGELGIVGLTLFVIILVITAVEAFINSNRVGLEFCVFLFYVVTFLGASALVIDSEYSFIFWYALGKINQKSSYSTQKAPLALKSVV